jgi:hypothetical protein
MIFAAGLPGFGADAGLSAGFLCRFGGGRRVFRGGFCFINAFLCHDASPVFAALPVVRYYPRESAFIRLFERIVS